MQTSPTLDAVRASLLRHGAPAAYVGRLVGELADHREDAIDEMTRAGATPEAAARAADERMGGPAGLGGAGGRRGGRRRGPRTSGGASRRRWRTRRARRCGGGRFSGGTASSS